MQACTPSAKGFTLCYVRRRLEEGTDRHLNLCLTGLSGCQGGSAHLHRKNIGVSLFYPPCPSTLVRLTLLLALPSGAPLSLTLCVYLSRCFLSVGADTQRSCCWGCHCFCATFTLLAPWKPMGVEVKAWLKDTRGRQNNTLLAPQASPEWPVQASATVAQLSRCA